MKTAEETLYDELTENHSYIIEGNFNLKESVLDAMKAYAKQAVEQALKDAYENAESNIVYHELDHGYPSCEIDKDSILNTEIKLP